MNSPLCITNHECLTYSRAMTCSQCGKRIEAGKAVWGRVNNGRNLSDRMCDACHDARDNKLVENLKRLHAANVPQPPTLDPAVREQAIDVVFDWIDDCRVAQERRAQEREAERELQFRLNVIHDSLPRCDVTGKAIRAEAA